MKRSAERVLTTHTGSLPRPPDLTAMLEALDAGALPDPSAFGARVRRAVAEIVRQQVDAGVDVVMATASKGDQRSTARSSMPAASSSTGARM